MLKHPKTNTKNIVALIIAIFIFITPVAALAASDPCADTTGNGNKVDQTKLSTCVSQSPVVHDLQTVVNFLSAGVGIIIIIMIIVGGVQYSLAGGSSDATSKAKTRIINALIALFAYLLIFAFVQWLIPGGVFK